MTAQTLSASIPETWNRRRYWVATGMLAALFLGSFALGILNPTETRTNAAKLGYPGYLVLYPLSAAKLAGVVTILWLRRWPTLVLFAFAGFFYDLVLALAAHIHEKDFPSGWLAVFGLVVWCAAFYVERDRVSKESRPLKAA